MASEPAAANGRARVTVGVGVGYGWGWGPYWGPWYYPPPYYYSQPVVIQQGPTTYIEQSPHPVDQANWWYYCDQSKGYYPYVKECPGGWTRVPPAPPDTTSR